MKFPTAMLGAALALGMAATACTNGQTGSAECALLPSCVCRSFAGRALFRGKVVTVDQRELRATVRVEETLAGAAMSAGGIEQGAEVAGTYSLGLPCEPTDSLAPLHVGDEVLLAYDRDGEPSLWLAHWMESLQLSDSATLASNTVAELNNESTCVSRFQGSPDPDCDDVVEIAGCSMDEKTRHEPSGIAGVLLPLLSALALRRRAAARVRSTR